MSNNPNNPTSRFTGKSRRELGKLLAEGEVKSTEFPAFQAAFQAAPDGVTYTPSVSASGKLTIISGVGTNRRPVVQCYALDWPELRSAMDAHVTDCINHPDRTYTKDEYVGNKKTGNKLAVKADLRPKSERAKDFDDDAKAPAQVAAAGLSPAQQAVLKAAGLA